MATLLLLLPNKFGRYILHKIETKSLQTKKELLAFANNSFLI